MVLFIMVRYTLDSKKICFEPSSPIRHITEIYRIIKDKVKNKEVICLYTHGPDRRVTYISVQIALIVLFLKTNADMVIAVRTPPQHSWKDPAERIMSILNTGLQATGLMHEKINIPALEHKLKSAKNMKERQLAYEIEGLEEGIKSSMLSVKQLLNNIFGQLKLKGKPLCTFDSANDEDMEGHTDYYR